MRNNGKHRSVNEAKLSLKHAHMHDHKFVLRSSDYSSLDLLKCTSVFWPIKQEHTILSPNLTTKLVALKACGLCNNGRIANATIRGQTGLGHLGRLRARPLLSSINWRTPFTALPMRPIISDYLGDPWLLCHFHTTGLIAPNGGSFWGNRWARQSMLPAWCQPLAVI